ncbi:hypothetical protein J5N97_028264 [Dioscorea zingiberensis]|uniref:Conserved oligomeric Golgi complex subunit 1 n=1 Tax=Dioscorea zingiberensis TaxID=325984 RepID=A0A9D5BY67_9LILI|nr:hypothetical protein J5N97_028264 [Dioscorea zingiberensis]
MRTPTRALPASPTADPAPRDAEALFRSKPIAEIRSIEASTRLDIDAKSEELRQLVGRSYRDLIDSADSILLMRSSCDSISSNLSPHRVLPLVPLLRPLTLALPPRPRPRPRPHICPCRPRQVPR